MGITINTPVVKDNDSQQVAKTEIKKANFERSVAMLTLPLVTVDHSILGLKMPIINVPLYGGQVLTYYQTISIVYYAEKISSNGSTPGTEIYSDS